MAQSVYIGGIYGADALEPDAGTITLRVIAYYVDTVGRADDGWLDVVIMAGDTPVQIIDKIVQAATDAAPNVGTGYSSIARTDVFIYDVVKVIV